MAEKVFDVRGEVDVDTKKAKDAIDRMARSTRAFGDAMLQSDRISVSLTRRLRSGFNTGMAAALRRDEGGFIAFGNAIQVASAGLKKIENESVLTLRVFQRLQRVGFATQSALGALAGSIGDLAGGFLSLVGVVSQAGAALVGVGGALMSLVGGFAVAKIAMSGVGKAVSQLWNGQNQYNRSLRDARKELKDLKFDLEGAVLSEQEAAIELEKARTALAMAQDLPPDNMVRREAELAFQRADLNYRRAKARVNDLQDTIKRGGRAAGSAANADPFRNLTKSQIVFAKYLASLKPIMQELKEVAASSFLPPLQNGIQNLVSTLLPSLRVGFGQLGSAMGYAAERFAGTFNRPDNLKAFQDFFTDSEPRIRQLGDASSKFLGGFLKLMQSSKPVTDRFIVWIDSVASRFNAMADSESTKRFLAIAGYVASQLGHVFGNFGDGIKNIMDANFPPGGGGAGQVLLDWLNGIALGFKKFTGSETFATWLKDTTTNATVMLGVIGDFLNIFIELSGRPEIKEFWTTLGKSIPDITKVLLDGLKAAPAFAALIVSVIDLFSAFSDTESISIFFDTLRSITDVFAAIFNNPVIKAILDFIGRINAVVLAVTLAISTMVLVGVGIGAILGQVAKNIGKLFAVGTGTLKWMTRFNLELAVGKPGIIGWGKALYNSIFGAISPTSKLGTTMDVLRASFAKTKIAFREFLLGQGLLNEGQSRFSKIIDKIKVGFSALKATVADAALYIRTSLTDAMKKFRDVAGPALSNARFALYTTLIQKGRLVSDFYNTRVMPVMTKFRDLIVNKFNDARLAIYGTLQQKGRMIADLYNTRVVPAFQRFMSTISPQAIRIKMLGFAMGMMMHIDLLDKRIIPAFMRIRDGIKNTITQIGIALSPENISARVIALANSLKAGIAKIGMALSPENIRLKTLGFRMGMMFHIDLLDKRIVPTFIRIRDGIKNAITQIGVALSPQNIQSKMSAIADSIRLGIDKIGAALSPQNIRLKTLGFRIGMMMQIDLIDKRIVPAFIRMASGVRTSLSNMRQYLLQTSDIIRRRFSERLYIATERLDLFKRMVGFNIAVLGRMNEIVAGRIVDGFKKFKTAVMQSTIMIKLNTAATKLAAAASQMWNGLTSKLSNVFRSTKDSLTGFIDRMKAKTATVQASTAANIAETVSIKNKTKALTEEQKAAAAAAGARRGGGGMAIMGAGFAAQGLISGVANGGMSTGSALTTLGGAMMFIPGGMIAGLVVGIVGAIVQGFESAEKAAREKQQAIIARKVEITAQSVQTSTATSNDELAQLLATGNYTYSEAGEEIRKRQGAATAAANRAGIVSTTGTEELNQVRLAFQEAGVKANSPIMLSLLEAAATYSSKSEGATAENISSAILSVFKAAGDETAGALKVSETFGPQAGMPATQLEVQQNEGVNTFKEVPTAATTANQVKAIVGILKDQASYSIVGEAGGIRGKKFLNPQLLAGFTSEAIAEAANTSFAKSLDGYTATILKNATENKQTRFAQNNLYGIAVDDNLVLPARNTGLNQNSMSSLFGSKFDFNTGKIMQPGQFSTADIANIKGTTRAPAIVELLPTSGDLKGLPAISDNTARTADALSFLSGVFDKEGGALKIIDVNASDNLAPQIYIPATGLTSSERIERENINKFLRDSWTK